MRDRYPGLGLVLFVICFLVPAANAQEPAQQKGRGEPQPNLRLLTFGGLLGQLDGFCEYPGGPYDIKEVEDPQPCGPGPAGDLEGAAKTSSKSERWPAALGGLLGAEEWLKRRKKSHDDLLLVQGNNLPPDFADAISYQRDRAGVSRDVEHRQRQALKIKKDVPSAPDQAEAGGGRPRAGRLLPRPSSVVHAATVPRAA